MKHLEEQPRKLLNSMLLVQRPALDMNRLSDTQRCATLVIMLLKTHYN